MRTLFLQCFLHTTSVVFYTVFYVIMTIANTLKLNKQLQVIKVVNIKDKDDNKKFKQN